MLIPTPTPTQTPDSEIEKEFENQSKNEFKNEFKNQLDQTQAATSSSANMYQQQKQQSFQELQGIQELQEFQGFDGFQGFNQTLKNKEKNKNKTKIKDKSLEKKLEIIEAAYELLAKDLILEQLALEKIPSAFSLVQLAKFMKVREATLQKSFQNTSLLLLEMIEQIEQHIFSQINAIESEQDDGMMMIHQIIEMILNSAENKLGFLRIITNEFNYGYEKYLNTRLQQLFDRIESSLRQAYRIAAAQGHVSKGEESSKANWLLNYVLGALLRYAKNTQGKKPSQLWPSHKKSIV